MPNHIITTIKFEDEKKFREVAISQLENGEDYVDFNKLIPMPKELETGSYDWEVCDKFGFGGEFLTKKLKFQEEKFENFLSQFYSEEITREEFIDKIREEISKPKNKDLLAEFNEVYRMGDETIYDQPREEEYVGTINPTFVKVIGGYYNYNKFGEVDWYNWRVKYWGTKWNSYDNYISDNSVSFDTAWATPEEWLQALAKQMDFVCSWADEDIGSNFGIGVAKGGTLMLKYLDDDEDFTFEDKRYLSLSIHGYDYEEWNEGYESLSLLPMERRNILYKSIADFV